jgi:hypothetical protein
MRIQIEELGPVGRRAQDNPEAPTARGHRGMLPEVSVAR